MLRHKFLAIFFAYALMLPVVAFAKDSESKIYQAPPEVIEQIKKEGMGENSQVMKTMSYLTNVIGGRLTNSPSMKRANEWTRDTMSGWGLQNAHLESWGPFGRGWSLNRFSAEVTSPQSIPVIAYPKAWSPSTPGAITGDVVYVDVKSEADFAKYRGKLKGAIVFVSNTRELKADFGGKAHRFTDEELLEMANAPAPPVARGGSSRLERFRARFANEDRLKQFLEARALSANVAKFILSEGAAVVVDNSRKGEGGTVFVSGASVANDPPKSLEDAFARGRSLTARDKAAESKMVPQMTMASEDYNRIMRMIELGQKVTMSVNIQAQYHDEDLMGYNTIAEIPGTDPVLKNEVVMLGAHLDSWHASGGATDNAAGSAVAMEAARILMKLGLKPRRTIRVALWSGEEQGLNGSRAYVEQHFGEANAKKPAYEKFSAYYNMDNGTGKFRGVYLQGNAKVSPIFRAWLAPFAKMGASTLTLRNTGGTDHLAFDAIGLPGFQFIQDPIEYSPVTHHSNQDNYDRIQAEDMKHNATIMAAFVYQTAMMDGKIPHKTQ